MSRRCSTDLSVRSDRKELTAYNGGTKSNWEAVLDAEADAGAWRLVEAGSTDSLPFDVQLSWTAGTGRSGFVRLSFARGGRACVYARSLSVLAHNNADNANKIWVTVADACMRTENVWEERGSLLGGNGTNLTIPAYARRLHLDTLDPTELPGVELRLFDYQNTQIATVLGDAQQSGGLDVGGLRGVKVYHASSTKAFRAVWTLSL